mmetsp:Transcript_70116/g.106026  ORF Transcript_70116/g.106026 Transcript_70116/m.106026 type:complete len:148 (+) Transcript_70116:94-537(+)
MTSVSSIACLVLLLVSSARAFQPLPMTQHAASTSSSSTTSLFYNEDPERSNHRVSTSPKNKQHRQSSEPPMECYLVEEDDEEVDDFESENSLAYQKPRVVCTTAPDEYAWFNGIDPERLIPTDATETGALECVEGASPRGIPEWECE